jgi:hypothetical protein
MNNEKLWMLQVHYYDNKHANFPNIPTEKKEEARRKLWSCGILVQSAPKEPPTPDNRLSNFTEELISPLHIRTAFFILQTEKI